MLSIVAGVDGGARVRRLPTLFLGPSPLFVDRDVERVVEQVERTVSFLQRAYEEAIFLVTPVKIGGSWGLYARDYNTRSTYRRRLERLGAEFGESPFSRLSDEGGFETDDMDPFRPAFAISESVNEPDTGVHPVSAGLLVSQVAMLRLGSMSTSELGSLAKALSGVRGLGSGQPAEVFEALGG